MHCSQTEAMLNMFMMRDSETKTDNYLELMQHLETCTVCHVEIAEFQHTLSTIESSLKPLSCPEDLSLHWDTVPPAEPAKGSEAAEPVSAGLLPEPVSPTKIKLTYHVEDIRETRELSEKVITVGRAPENTLPVPDQKTSRLHCCIESTPRGYVVTDHGSVNGTIINGQRISGPVILKPGDIIEIGFTRIGVDAIDGVFVSEEGSKKPAASETAEQSPHSESWTIRLTYYLDQNRERREFREKLITIGRANDNVLPIHDQKISRFHSRIERTSQGYVIHDLGSINGTVVNGDRIEGPAALKAGDIIDIGFTKITIDEIERPEAAQNPATPQGTLLAPDTKAAKPKPVTPPSPARRIRLTTQFEQASETREFRQKVITIGRSDESILTIPDKKISRFHTSIESTPQGYMVTDGGSVNGTAVNGQRITGPTILKPNDVIEIGFSKITVNAIEDAVPAAGPTSRSVRSLARAGRTDDNVRTFFRVAIPAAVILLAIALYMWFRAPSGTVQRQAFDQAQSRRYAPQQPLPPVPVLESSAAVQTLTRDLETLRDDVELASKITQSHVDRMQSIQTRVAGIAHTDTRNEFERRLQDLSRTMSEKIQDVLIAQLGKLETETEPMLKSGNYAEVFQKYKDLKNVLKHSFWEDSIMDQMSRIDRQYVEPEAKKLQQQEAALKSGKKYKEAIDLIQKHLARFKGTRYYEDFDGRVKDLSRLDSELAKAAVERPKSPAEKPPVEKTRAEKTPGAKNSDPEDAAERQRLEAQKKMVATMASKAEKAEQLLKDGKTIQAEAIYYELGNNPDITSEQAEQYLRRYHELHNSNAFTHILIDSINSGKLSTAKVRTPAGSQGTPSKADLNGITFLVNNAPVVTPWDKITPPTFHELMLKAPLGDDELYTLAEYAIKNKLDKEARATIQKFMGSDTGEKQARGFELIAKMKGLTKVPDGGFVFDAKANDFVSARAKKEKEATASVDKLLKELSTAVDNTLLDKRFEQLYSMVSDSALSESMRSDIKSKTAEALKANKAGRLDKVKKGSGAAVNLDKLKELKQKLNDARAEALKTIFDTSIYPDANHGRSGQGKVDEVVKKVEDIWEGSGKMIVQGSPELNRQIEAIKKINEDYLTKLGEATDKDELAGLDEIINNLVGSVSLRTYALNGEERKSIEYNQKVDKYNQDLKGIPDDIKKQVWVTNEYREMLGRKRLFIDERLFQAAQFHTENQRKAGKIWHDGDDGTVSGRMKKFNVPSSGAGENVLMGSRTPEQAHRQWYNSSGHHRNILGKMWNAMGAGHDGAFWTQNFAYIRQAPVK